MQFKPLSEEEATAGKVLPEGEYDFEVLTAEETTSKKGNSMIKVNLGIYQGDAMTWKIFDFLLPLMEAKLRHFCDTTGLLAKYESGTLTASDCKGRAGKVMLAVEKSEQFGAQNKVKDYVCRSAKPLAGPSANAAAPPSEADDDNVPF